MGVGVRAHTRAQVEAEPVGARAWVGAGGLEEGIKIYISSWKKKLEESFLCQKWKESLKKIFIVNCGVTPIFLFELTCLILQEKYMYKYKFIKVRLGDIFKSCSISFTGCSDRSTGRGLSWF